MALFFAVKIFYKWYVIDVEYIWGMWDLVKYEV